MIMIIMVLILMIMIIIIPWAGVLLGQGDTSRCGQGRRAGDHRPGDWHRCLDHQYIR